jgi:hypothetical protein
MTMTNQVCWNGTVYKIPTLLTQLHATDGYAGEVVIEAVQSEGIRCKGLNGPNLLINPVDDAVKGLRGVLFDGEEVLVSLEPRSRGGLDKSCLESVPDLDRILRDISDIDLDLRGHAGDKKASCLEGLVHPVQVLLPC